MAGRDPNFGDPVRRGQVVVELDDAEYVQAVAQADADLAVTRARLVQARSDLLTATREMERMVTLAARGVASESELDLAGAGQAAEEAQLQVAQAQVIRAEAELETARIRLRYTRVTATWTEGDDDRVVAERHVDVGQTVSPGEPLLRVVELSPLTGVLHVTEKDYSRLARGQAVTLTTDAWPGERFAGAIARIAPVFRESSRQAQVEVEVPNLDQRLKPGMFVRATVVLQRVDDALSVPESALSSRDDRPGLFVVDEATRTVSWRHVTPGIRDRGRVQIVGLELSGRVVTLGQQLLDEGSAITIPADGSAAP